MLFRSLFSGRGYNIESLTVAEVAHGEHGMGVIADGEAVGTVVAFAPPAVERAGVARKALEKVEQLPGDDQVLDLGRSFVDPQRAHRAIQAIDRVFRETTVADLVARQQEFVKAFKQQVSSSLSPFDLPKLVTADGVAVTVIAGQSRASILGLRELSCTCSMPMGCLAMDSLMLKAITVIAVCSRARAAALFRSRNCRAALAIWVSTDSTSPPPKIRMIP